MRLIPTWLDKTIKRMEMRRVNTSETGKARAYTASGIAGQWDAVQDSLTAKKGTAIYSEMRSDADVKAGLFVKSAGVLSKGWEIQPGADKDDPEYAQAEAQAEFIRNALDDLPGSLDDVLEEILTDGLGCGTSIAEKNYKLRDDGLIGYASIKPKDPTLYSFDLDDYNNVTGLWLTGIGLRAALDPAKFALFNYQSKHGEPWGESDLRAAYKYWWAKDKIMKYWLIRLEKFGMPTAKGTYPTRYSEEMQDALLSVLSSIQKETAITVPDDVTVELMEAGHAGDAAYLSALEYCGNQIVKSILGQTLTSGEGQRVGSMALGKVHQDTLALYVRRLKRTTEEFMDEQIIRDLIDLNFADPVYPNFTLLYDDTDKGALSEFLFRLEQSGIIYGDEPWIREYIGIPAMDDEYRARLEARQQAMEDAMGGAAGDAGERAREQGAQA